MELIGNVAIVTGGSMGIGYGVADPHAPRADVVITARNEGEITAAAQAVSAAHAGRRAIGVVATASSAEDFERVYGFFPRLRERQRQLAGTLSGGEQQMLAVSRALMLNPRLMLLDEPSLGLAPLVVQEIFRILRTVNQESGVSILLVEQNAKLALDLADHVFLLETGRVVMSGPSAVLTQDDSIRRSYLGY